VKRLPASPKQRKWALTSGVALLALLTLAVFLYLPRLGSDECFNQRTGAPIKWYVEEPNGDVTMFSSGGFDIVTGAEKQPVTPEICAGFAKQENKGGPRRITTNSAGGIGAGRNVSDAVSPLVNRSFRRLVVLRSAINHPAFIIAGMCKAPRKSLWKMISATGPNSEARDLDPQIRLLKSVEPC
jgi:hypothetical protein